MSTNTPTTDEEHSHADGEWTAAEIAAARDLAEQYGEDDPLGQICKRIAQSVDNEEAMS